MAPLAAMEAWALCEAGPSAKSETYFGKTRLYDLDGWDIPLMRSFGISHH